MDLYNIDSALSQGNQISSEARGVAMTNKDDQRNNIVQANRVLANDKGGEKLDIAKFSATDTLGGIELPHAIGEVGRTASEAGGYASLAKGDIGRVGSGIASGARSAVSGAKAGAQGASDLAGVAGRSLGLTPTFTPSAVRGSEEMGQALASKTAGTVGAGTSRGLRGTGIKITSEDHVAPPSAVEESVNSGVEVGAKGVAKYDSVADAGSLTKFALRNIAGVTSEAGLELGSKGIAGLGGALAGEEDIKNLITTGHVFQKGESGWSEAGNIGQMGGAILDVASVALPFLAPFALAANLLSAGASTYGNVEDDQQAKDKAQAQQTNATKPMPQAVAPAWSQMGMVASQHQIANPVQ